MTATMNATIETGLTAVREWQRGNMPPLKSFMDQSLTRKGATLLFDGLIREGSHDDYYRDLIARAVACGY